MRLKQRISWEYLWNIRYLVNNDIKVTIPQSGTMQNDIVLYSLPAMCRWSTRQRHLYWWRCLFMRIDRECLLAEIPSYGRGDEGQGDI